MFHYTVDVNNSVEETISALEEQLKTEQFGLLWTFNIQEKLQEKGFDFKGKYVVLEVCNPAEANRVLSEAPLAGYFLPCKIVVYEAEEKVRIGMTRPSVFMDLLQNDSLKGIAEDIEARLIKCINAVSQTSA